MKRIFCTMLIVLLIAATACAPKTTEAPEVTEEPVTVLATAAPEKPAAEEPAAQAPAQEAPAQEAPAEEAEPDAAAEAEPEPEPAVYESEITETYLEGWEGDPDYLMDRSQDKLAIVDETTADYSHISYYTGDCYNNYTMRGTYTADGNTIVFTSMPGTDVYTFTIDGTKITKTEFSYRDISAVKAQGTYKNADYTLEIREDGSAELSSFRGARYTGSIYEMSDGTWEFMAYEESTDTSVDYVITLNDGRFTMETFAHKRFSRFAGEYNMTGDLGKFVLTVDTEGNATADVNIFGEELYASGYIYLGDEDQAIEGCTLGTDRGHQIYLTFGERFGDTINYYGNMTVPLAAG